MSVCAGEADGVVDVWGVGKGEWELGEEREGAEIGAGGELGDDSGKGLVAD